METELAILKRLLREEIAHAAFNHHVLDPSSQGWEPNVPVVRASSIEDCIEGAERCARRSNLKGDPCDHDATSSKPPQ